MRSLAVCSRLAAARSVRSYGTGWPKPSPRQPVQPYERSEVDARLAKTGLPAEVRVLFDLSTSGVHFHLASVLPGLFPALPRAISILNSHKF